MANPLPEVAQALREIRRTNGWSCEELARRAEMPLETILEYESNPETLSAETAGRAFKALTKDSAGDDELFDDPATLFSASPPPEVVAEMEARLLELEAALRIDEARFRDALALIERALSLTRKKARTGRLFLDQAAVLGEMSRERRALEALSGAERCLDPEREPTVWLRLRLEQMYFLCHEGQHGEAAALQAETQELAARIGRDKDRLQARFLDGWIATATGQTAEALQILQGVREELLATRRTFDATAVGLDLAGLLIHQGRRTEVDDLAQQLEPLTQSAKIPAAARPTLKVFCWAVRRGNLTAEMARRLAAELRKAGGRLMRPYELP
jgi:transcriptional regulator with XRE-family HTH domain